jgi:hypothetical protein
MHLAQVVSLAHKVGINQPHIPMHLPRAIRVINVWHAGSTTAVLPAQQRAVVLPILVHLGPLVLTVTVPTAVNAKLACIRPPRRVLRVPSVRLLHPPHGAPIRLRRAALSAPRVLATNWLHPRA